MISRMVVVCLLSLLTIRAADQLVHVRGEITGGHGVPTGSMIVDLLDLRNQGVDRAHALADGSFEFQRVPAGEYNVLVTFNGAVLLRTMISLRELTSFVSLRVPNVTVANPASGSISVRRLGA